MTYISRSSDFSSFIFCSEKNFSFIGKAQFRRATLSCNSSYYAPNLKKFKGIEVEGAYWIKPVCPLVTLCIRSRTLRGRLLIFVYGIRMKSNSSSSSSTIFKHLLIRNRWASQSQISYEASTGWANGSLFKWPKSCDQDVTYCTARSTWLPNAFVWENA